ncbi:MAG: hypothetical protein LBJ47_06390 [Tannerella sp.]|nr:hypothetical protein [Tannerella sp.]
MIARIITCISLFFAISGDLTASDICISEIRISGNKSTKDFTITRELPFRTGDVMPEDRLIHLLNVATENLNNISLFNYVYVDYMPDSLDREDCLSCIVTIRVEERWYYWPQVSFKIEDRNLSNWLHEREFNRITIGWGMRIYNVFGMRHKITVSDYFGYEKGGRLAYSNIALDRERTQLLSVSMSALFNKTLNTHSSDDRAIYIKNPNLFLERSADVTVGYSYRPGIRMMHSFDIGYGWVRLNDTVLEMNRDYWGTEHLTNNTFTFAYKYSYEHRDYIAYPTKGYFIGADVTGITADKMRFFYGELNLKLQYYREFVPRWFWSSRLNAGASFKNKRAYIYDRHVGYEEKYVTGYDYYVIDGQHHAILNNDARFLIMPKRIFNLWPKNSSAKFTKIHFTLYAKLICDVGYVYNSYRQANNTLANTFLWGSGIGLDLVTYYDIVLNASYAINKMGEGGFYFGIKAPVF